MKIGICGGGGTGKSSLAAMAADKLSIPLLRSRDITDDILKRDGYDYSSGIQIERFLANTGRQNEMLMKTIEQQGSDEFVADRTFIDLAAYAVCELCHSDVVALRRIVDACKSHVNTYTHIFLCPWVDGKPSTNNKRTLNPWYQYLIYVTEMGLMKDWGCSYHLLSSKDNSVRVNEIVSAVRSEVKV